VSRQDLNGALISEADATMGLGPKTPNVRLEERNVGEGQTLLSLVNGEGQPVFVGGWISIRKNGTEIRRCGLGILVQAVGRERACVVFSGEQYIYYLDSEKDPE
jgi:hypothetical protein